MVITLKTNRLLGITILLLNRETVTAKELAERFGVSTRTIYRDVDVYPLPAYRFSRIREMVVGFPFWKTIPLTKH